MNTKSFQLSYLVLLALGMLGACGGGGGGGGSLPGPSGTIQIEATDYDAAEGTVLNIRVARSGGHSGVARVDFVSTDGTAVGGVDFTAVSGTLTWANGVWGNRTISIPITDDGSAEGAESFTLALSNVSGATLGPNTSATINIVDNDVAAVSAYGPITALNSATINGIRYRTNDTVVNINGVPASFSDLKLGQLVVLDGEVNFSDATGIATEISYSASVIGPVEHIDAALNQLIIMGQTVRIEADTVLDASIDPDTFAGLTVGHVAQVSGYRNADGDIIASRIEPDSMSTAVQLIGKVSGLDLANMLFSVNRLTVDYSSAVLIDLPAGMPADGQLVILRGTLTNGILAVNEIVSVDELVAPPGERVHLGGIVTRFSSPTDFDLNGIPVASDASTSFVNGVVDQLQVNAEITIDGEFSGGGTLLANEVTFGRPVSNRTTSALDFDNFTKVSVLGFSRVTVVQGPEYSVEVSAASAIINDVEVTRSGDTITIGNNRTLMLNAFVTMPLLDRIDIAAGALANVTLRNFDQSQMTVNVSGVSLLRGEELRISDLTATVSGVSSLAFGSIGPIGNANIDVDGVSQATLNMAVGSTLAGAVRTGQGTGVSTLFYYGTNVTANVTTDSVSRVVRLGDTKL